MGDDAQVNILRNKQKTLQVQYFKGFSKIKTLYILTSGRKHITLVSGTFL